MSQKASACLMQELAARIPRKPSAPKSQSVNHLKEIKLIRGADFLTPARSHFPAEQANSCVWKQTQAVPEGQGEFQEDRVRSAEQGPLLSHRHLHTATYRDHVILTSHIKAKAIGRSIDVVENTCEKSRSLI